MKQTYLSPHDPSSHRLPAAKIVDSRICDLHTPSPSDAYSRASYQLINITGSASNKQAGNYAYRTRSSRPERPYRPRVVVNREKPTSDCRQTVQTVPITCTQVSICRCLSSRFRVAANTIEKSRNRRANFAPAFR